MTMIWIPQLGCDEQILPFDKSSLECLCKCITNFGFILIVSKEISVTYSTVRCLRMPVSIILTRETYKSSVHQDKNRTMIAWLTEKHSYVKSHWKKHSMIWLAQCNRPRLWKKSHSYHQQHSALSSTPVSFRQAIQTVFVKMKRNSNRHVSTLMRHRKGSFKDTISL